jgi:hypothetical protein
MENNKTDRNTGLLPILRNGFYNLLKNSLPAVTACWRSNQQVYIFVFFQKGLMD